MEKMNPVEPGTHMLPPLPYPANALEPVISAEILQIHHDKHHKKYVDNLNAAELALVEARKKADYKFISYWENQIAFNGSGHILHSIYWTNMTYPDKGGGPENYTRTSIDWYFGGFEQFKAQYTAAAKNVEASGWCILGYNTAFSRLEVLQCEKHQNLTQWGIIPVLVCDVWEHAYYLQYQNNKDSYIDQWWRLVNWANVESRLVQAAQGFTPLT